MGMGLEERVFTAGLSKVSKVGSFNEYRLKVRVNYYNQVGAWGIIREFYAGW